MVNLSYRRGECALLSKCHVVMLEMHTTRSKIPKASTCKALFRSYGERFNIRLSAHGHSEPKTIRLLGQRFKLRDILQFTFNMLRK